MNCVNENGIILSLIMQKCLSFIITFEPYIFNATQKNINVIQLICWRYILLFVISAFLILNKFWNFYIFGTSANIEVFVFQCQITSFFIVVNFHGPTLVWIGEKKVEMRKCFCSNYLVSEMVKEQKKKVVPKSRKSAIKMNHQI